MKTNQILPLIIAAALTAFTLTGCSDYENGYSEGQLKFIKGFENQFGDIDPEQDWNLATRGTVTVTTSEPTDVNVYTVSNGTYTLVGQFFSINGTETLTFDMQKSAENIVVSNGGVALRTLDGGFVSFVDETSSAGNDAVAEASTRAVNVNGNLWYQEWIRPVNVTATECDKVVKAFAEPIYVKNSTPIPWPNYWVQQVYKGVTQYTDLAGNNAFTGSDCMNLMVAYNGTTGDYEHVNDFNSGSKDKYYVDDITKEKFYGTTLMYNMSCNIGDKQFGYHNTKDSKFHYEYIILEVDGSYYVGFDFDAEGYGVNKNMTVERDYIYNDWIVKISPAMKSHVDPADLNNAENQAWVLAAEDFGGDGSDIDYNDVVFQVERTGTNKALVTPLAAGGTLASYIYYGDECIGEIHQMLGAGVEKSGSYDPLNVGGVEESACQTKEITVDKDWSMAYDYTTDGNMGGFYIKVLDAGETASAVPANGVLTDVPAPKLGGAPYIICVPYSYVTYNEPSSGQKTTTAWSWPEEKCNIETVYTMFRAWVSDRSTNANWFQFPVKNARFYHRYFRGSYTSQAVSSMTSAENTASGSCTSFTLSLPDYHATEVQESNLTLIQQSVDVAPNGTINLRDYISTSSTGEIRYYPDNTEIWNVNNGGYTESTMQVSGNRKAHVVKIHQDATNNYKAGEVSITVNVLESANLHLNEWRVNNQGGNTSGTSKEETMAAGTPFEFTVEYNGAGALTSYVSNSNGSNATITQDGKRIRVNTGTQPGKATITVTLAKDMTNFWQGGEITVVLNLTDAQKEDPNLWVNNTPQSLTVGDENYNTQFGSNSGGNITVSSSDANVATVEKNGNSNLKIVAKNAGRTTITLSQEANGNYNAKSVSFEVEVKAKSNDNQGGGNGQYKQVSSQDIASWHIPASYFAGATKVIRIKVTTSNYNDWGCRLRLYYTSPSWTDVVNYEDISPNSEKVWTFTKEQDISSMKKEGLYLGGNNIQYITGYYIAVE